MCNTRKWQKIPFTKALQQRDNNTEGTKQAYKLVKNENVPNAKKILKDFNQ